MKQADPEAQLRFRVARSDLERFAEIAGGLIPAAQLLQANRQLEIAAAVMRFELDQVRISFHALLVALQLVEDVAHGREDGGLVLATLYGPSQFAQRFLGLAFQVQGYRSR